MVNFYPGRQFSSGLFQQAGSIDEIGQVWKNSYLEEAKEGGQAQLTDYFKCLVGMKSLRQLTIRAQVDFTSLWRKTFSGADCSQALALPSLDQLQSLPFLASLRVISFEETNFTVLTPVFVDLLRACTSLASLAVPPRAASLILNTTAAPLILPALKETPYRIFRINQSATHQPGGAHSSKCPSFARNSDLSASPDAGIT